MQVNEKDRDQVASTKAFIYSYFVLIFWFVTRSKTEFMHASWKLQSTLIRKPGKPKIMYNTLDEIKFFFFFKNYTYYHFSIYCSCMLEKDVSRDTENYYH